MDLDAAADDLYGVPPEEFVERRQALVGEARQVKDRELVRQIGALRKPTRTGWLVNLLARAEPAAVEDLLALGQALAEAQQRRSGPDLRRLSQQRRTTVDALARRTLELGRQHGYVAPDAAHQEVAQSLQAALGDPEVAELLRRGRLTQAVSYGGFGLADLTGAPAAAPAAPSEPKSDGEPEPDEARDAEAEPKPDEEAERRAAFEQRLGAAEQTREQTRVALEAGQAEADRATSEADELADLVQDLRTRLSEAEESERVARDRARSARKDLAGLRQAQGEAEGAVAAARAMLDP